MVSRPDDPHRGGPPLDRIGRILRPGGVLRLHDLVYDFQPSEADAVCQRWLAHAADGPTLGYTRADLAGSVYGAYTCRRR